ncbi:hypothetical protein [uncultured Akkermansia sp.]|uniref:hypothetical protein n=1 Tax=uncultured Akkermansia sp. TaxID=512294 RepID=UPI00265D342A|nr:hypothetical protein [uncultured Akkermansia sp.]
MIRQFRLWVLPVLLMMFPSMAQDVVEPSMVNVDLETEEGKKMAAYQEAVERHLWLGLVCSYIIEGEMGEMGRRKMLMAMLKHVVSPEWLKTLDQCPSDYRDMHLNIIKGSKELLERVEKEKMDYDRFMEAYEKHGAECMKMGAGIMKKYQLGTCAMQFFSFLRRETKGLDKAESLKVLYRIKKDILSGKLKISEESEKL